MTRLKLLFVDDDGLVLKALRHLLFRERERWDMTFANGGQEALDAMATTHFDAIISDLRMPDIDGARVMQVAYASSPTSARVILTGSSLSTLQDILPLLDTWIAKPCDRSTLIAKIEEAIAMAVERR